MLFRSKRDVAVLAAAEAEAWKREQILRGEGEAQRRQLVMNADGALDKKLEAFVKTQELWADAFKSHTGPLVPTLQMGGNGTNGSNAVSNTQQFMDLLSAKAAKDLALDLSLPAKK